MKFRPTQFGVRGNTASPRQHASRLAVDTDSNAFCIEEEMPEIPRSSPLNNPPTAVFERLPNFSAIFTSRLSSATHDGEVFRDIKLAATGIFVLQSWTFGCNLG